MVAVRGASMRSRCANGSAVARFEATRRRPPRSLDAFIHRETTMKVCVLGGGHGCHAAAIDLFEKGHDVTWWRRDREPH
ncbi:NAD-dependent glycerol-3-phosphate dehydrogenase-like protein, partial [Burkholderia sp. TJI49]